jgi:alcohol dehydrogenase
VAGKNIENHDSQTDLGIPTENAIGKTTTLDMKELVSLKVPGTSVGIKRRSCNYFLHHSDGSCEYCKQMYAHCEDGGWILGTSY